MAPRKSLGDLKRLVGHYERDLLRRNGASQDELDELREKYKPEGSRPVKDDYWQWWADLRAFIKRGAWIERKRGNIADADALENALAALEERPEFIELPSAGVNVRITPASRSRIEILEDHANLELRLEIGRRHLHGLILDGKALKNRARIPELCSECERPLEAGDTADLLKRITSELQYQRSCIYAQVTAPGPEPVPVGTTVEWADKITPEENLALLGAYHRVNLERLRNLPKPVATDGSALPQHWSFLFARQAAREKKPAHVIMRDRSLVSIIAVAILEGHRDDIQRKEAKAKAATKASAKGSRGSSRRARQPRARRRR